MANLEMQKDPTKSSGGSSSQSFLEVSEIKDDIIVTKDGGLRAVIAISSTNFILKSQDEQQAIISKYQGFLNSLEFPLQILMQSRHLHIHAYLEKLQALQMKQTNELLRMQTEEYIAYITKLLEFGNIMNKTFYAVIPFSAGVIEKAGALSKLKNLIAPGQKIIASQQRFFTESQQLNERVIRVESEFSSLGLRTMRLHTSELVELLYNSYNVTTSRQGQVDIGELKLN